MNSLLMGFPRLRSLTLESCCDLGLEPGFNSALDFGYYTLKQMDFLLSAAKDTLEVLVLAVEYFDSKKADFDQPRSGFQTREQLDLTEFGRLHTVEIPYSFLTGTVDISSMCRSTPKLPSTLRRLALRTDLSSAQFILQTPMNATSQLAVPQHPRVSSMWKMASIVMFSMFQTIMAFIDKLPQLECLEVWQPELESLKWHDSQFRDLVTSCSNNSITVRILYPQTLRQKNAACWDSVREVTLFDPLHLGQGSQEMMWQGERRGVPLGLATQYHINALKTGEWGALG